MPRKPAVAEAADAKRRPAHRIAGSAGLGLSVGAAAALWALALAPVAAADPSRRLYAVDESAGGRGAISVYDIDRGHRLLKTIPAVPRVGDVRGLAASAATGRLYVAYRTTAGAGMIYCLDLGSDRIEWNRRVDPGVDRLAISPDGRVLYVPTGEYGTAGFINILDAATGEPLRRVYFSKRSHDTQYPLAGPVFQTTKAGDGSGRFLYRIDPRSYAVSPLGPYAGILGPYAVDSRSRYVVNNVTGLWGMQVAELTTGRIATATLAAHPQGDPGLMHGIGWTPDEAEVWQDGSEHDPHVYVWDMRNPMAPTAKHRLPLRSGHGAHWLTFAINGDYAYVAPEKDSSDGTEIFDARAHRSLGTIGASEDMLEIDFAGGRVVRVGDQYGIGRR